MGWGCQSIQMEKVHHNLSCVVSTMHIIQVEYYLEGATRGHFRIERTNLMCESKTIVFAKSKMQICYKTHHYPHILISPRRIRAN